MNTILVYAFMNIFVVLCLTNMFGGICFWFVHFMSMHDSCQQHTHASADVEITRTLLSCGGDECDADSLSLLIQSYIPTCILVCVCVYIFIYL